MASSCQWLDFLRKDIGFDGFRFDYCKGYSGEYVGEFIGAMNSTPKLCVGEFWADCDYTPDGRMKHNQDRHRNVRLQAGTTTTTPRLCHICLRHLTHSPSLLLAQRQDIAHWCTSTGGLSSAFDFTTKGILQEAIYTSDYSRLADAQGRPAGLIGIKPAHASTFIENHDTGSTQRHWPFPYEHILQG